LNLRKKNNLPPYERFISLILSSKDEKKLEIESSNFKDYLQKKIIAKILGPVNAPIYKIKKNYRIRLLIRSKKEPQIQKSLSQALQKFKFSSGIKLTVDVDPITFN
jgi:primosomal protein N' (replication factor Y)